MSDLTPAKRDLYIINMLNNIADQLNIDYCTICGGRVGNYGCRSNHLHLHFKSSETTHRTMQQWLEGSLDKYRDA